MMRWISCAVFLLVWCLGTPAVAKTVTRYALVIGSNRGDTETAPLRWAQRDAEAMKRVLTQYAGVPASRVILLRDPDVGQVTGALKALQRNLGAAGGGRTEFILYYSGHATEKGLMLGPKTFPYAELRGWVKRLPATLGVVMLDACASGEIARAKGGKHIPALPVFAGREAKGRVYLTSASSQESAQESDTLRGATFTHYLINGMRGAADTTGDRNVTLQELYQFAFQQTLRRTQGSRLGPQHPRYDITLQGQGDLVIASVQKKNARLKFDASLRGQVSIWDAQDKLVAEFRKTQGHGVLLGVEPGAYKIFLRHEDRAFDMTTSLKAGEAVEISQSQLAPLEPERRVRARGRLPMPVVGDPNLIGALRELRTFDQGDSFNVIGSFPLDMVLVGTMSLPALAFGVVVPQIDSEENEDLGPLVPVFGTAFVGGLMGASMLYGWLAGGHVPLGTSDRVDHLLAHPELLERQGWGMLYDLAQERKAAREDFGWKGIGVGLGLGAVAGGFWWASVSERCCERREKLWESLAWGTAGTSAVFLSYGLSKLWFPSPIEMIYTHASEGRYERTSTVRWMPTLQLSSEQERVQVGVSAVW